MQSEFDSKVQNFARTQAGAQSVSPPRAGHVRNISDNARDNPSRFSVSGILFLSLVSFYLIVTCIDFRQSIKFVNLVIAAEHLEAQKPISDLATKRATTLLDVLVKDDYCRSDIILSGVTVALDGVDRLNSVESYDAWLRAANSAEVVIRHSISCMPTNGNLWLRLAALHSTIAESPSSLARLMSLSATLTPLDEPVVLARLYFWNHLSAETLKKAKVPLESDLRALLGSGNTKKVAESLQNVSVDLAPFVSETGKLLPADRRKALADMGLNLLRP